jgi:hypothetical protein
MKGLYIILSFLIFNSCSISALIQIGDSKSRLSDLEETNRFTLVNPGTSSKLYLLREKNINYLLSFDINDKINYLIIDEKTFSTPENLKKCDTVSLCIEKGGILMVEEGVCFFIILPSGWFAYIEEINADVNKIANLKIKFFYKKEISDDCFFVNFEDYIEKRRSINSFNYIRENKIIILEP